MRWLLIFSGCVLFLVGCGSSGEPAPFGKPIPDDADFVEIPEILKNPQEYGGKEVFVKGCVVNQCPTSGCWIEVIEMKGKTDERITVHLRGPAFDDRIDEIRGKLKGRCVRVKAYVSVQSGSVELHASSLEVVK